VTTTQTAACFSNEITYDISAAEHDHHQHVDVEEKAVQYLTHHQSSSSSKLQHLKHQQQQQTTSSNMPYIYNSASIGSTHSKSKLNNSQNQHALSSSSYASPPVTRSETADSQEDLRLAATAADSSSVAMSSPISSLASTTCSPRSSSTANLSSHAVAHTPSPVVPSAHQFIIPTRYVDRRVSTSVTSADPYKFNVNYSEAGQRLAKKAQEQLKVAEKIKETAAANAEVVVTSSSIRNSGSRRNSTDAAAGNGNETSEMGDDWQYVS
jgi:hypothetical protein